MKKKSLTVNALLNGIKTIMSIVFPLISFPYVSRILQVDNIGKYNFAASVISYFLMIAALGISTYSVREGAKYVDDKEKLSEFASEIFTINVLSTLVAYVLLVVCVFLVPKFQEYRALIYLLSIQIALVTIGVEWLYQIYENYTYITIRSIVVQAASLILMFVLIRTEEAVYNYAVVTVLAAAGSNIFNWFHMRKMCKVHLTKHIKLKEHMKPIMIIFGTEIAKTVYVSSDTTILGFLATDYNVGLYSVSTKIYTIIKSLLASILIVSIPRLSGYLGNQKYEDYHKTLNDIANALLMVSVPAMVGLICISDYVVELISGANYLAATNSLRILSVALLVSVFGWLFNSCVLIPYKKENKVLITMIVSALLNIILNLILIPRWKQDAAAFTTLLAEATALVMCAYYAKDLVKIKLNRRNLLSTILGSLLIVCICMVMRLFDLNVIVNTVLTISLSAVVYGLVLVAFKNPMLKYVKELLMKRRSPESTEEK